MLVCLVGCGPGLVEVPASDGCENLSSQHCLLPWPSDRFLEADSRTVTGWRLAYTANSLPANDAGVRANPRLFSRLDGFSPASRVMVRLLRPVDLLVSRAPLQNDIGRSLAADSPTVLLNMRSGERVAHWVEHDLKEPTLLWLHPAEVLEANTPYAVALRGLVDGDGQAISAEPGFRAVRDGVRTNASDLESRRPRFDELLKALGNAGIERRSLQMAWRFHTASNEAMHGDMLTVRDRGLERLGPAGLGCTVTSVENDYGPGDAGVVFRRLRGTYTVPSLMESPRPPTKLARDAEGKPTVKENVEVPFTIIVPRAVAAPASGLPRPSRVIVYGHGLMSEGDRTISSLGFRQVSESLQSILVATDWAGMSVSDSGAVAEALGDINRFASVAERLQQGLLNTLALIRGMKGSCAQLPELRVQGVDLVDPARVYFAGGSQGGIFGATVLRLAPDTDRGVVMVNGAAFPFMIERSIDFAPFIGLFEANYPDRTNRALALASLQSLWDATDPATWLRVPTDRRMLSISVKNDSQVPNLASDLVTRTARLSTLAGTARTPWGTQPAGDNPRDGALVIDMGDRPVPEGIIAPTENDKGHSRVLGAASAQGAIDRFLQPQGVIEVRCQGVCDPD
jgi:pimeloyl-ACP methyl ester carboxylesterase